MVTGCIIKMTTCIHSYMDSCMVGMHVIECVGMWVGMCVGVRDGGNVLRNNKSNIMRFMSNKL